MRHADEGNFSFRGSWHVPALSAGRRVHSSAPLHPGQKQLTFLLHPVFQELLLNGLLLRKWHPHIPRRVVSPNLPNIHVKERTYDNFHSFYRLPHLSLPAPGLSYFSFC